ncbi:hypothetical protein [Aquimarina algiphila]|uniref:Uncharacterized protein n=1 Tax=Aquimarina algiphila TaxID=2047982 RepID=A0A554VNE5_9FLAO|nr:hypothetical protein [Aquimarina algiphila]TSE09880.1 hypothetical protein FOF46_07645 [Aquimarina algiphila]
MNKTAKNILKYLIEIIIVAFGVFLGVYFSNVNAENKTKAEKEKSLRIIIKELENNQLLLEKHINYHENIKIQIDSIALKLSEKDKLSNFTTDNKFNHNNIKGWNGFQFARLQKTAFEGTKISGILKEFDIELIQKISSVYVLQETYTDFGTSILNKAIETNSSTKVIDFIGVIELMTSDLLILEKRLNEGLKKTITELKTPDNIVYK